MTKMAFAKLFPSHSSLSYLPDVLYTSMDDLATAAKSNENKPEDQVQRTSMKALSKKGKDGEEERSSAPLPFPWKVHDLLNDAEAEGFTHIVSWLPGHTAFRVHKQKLFVEEIMPRYFKQTKYRSFRRQLNLWGFERLLRGPLRGGYHNPNFVHRRPSLCHNMKRVEIKGIEQMKIAMAKKSFNSSSAMKDIKNDLPDPMLSFSSSFSSLKATWTYPLSKDLFDDDTLSSVLPKSFFDVSQGAEDQTPVLAFEPSDDKRSVQAEKTLRSVEKLIQPSFLTCSQ